MRRTRIYFSWLYIAWKLISNWLFKLYPSVPGGTPSWMRGETSLKKSSRLLFKLSRLPGSGWLWSCTGKTTDSTVCTHCLPLTHIFDVKKTRQLSSIDPASGPDACKPVVVDFSDGQDSARHTDSAVHWLSFFGPPFVSLLPAHHIQDLTLHLQLHHLKKVCCIQIQKTYSLPLSLLFWFQSESGKLEEISLTRKKLNKTLLS